MKQFIPEITKRERAEFIDILHVSRETAEKLDIYAGLLADWNEKFNLVSQSSLPHIWKRHFFDSAQLGKFMPSGTKMVADLGSGAGFPGLVLGIMGIAHVHLIESIGKKANFLSEVVKTLNLDVTVRQTRIESIHGIKFDVIMARALKPLPELLKLSNPLMKNDSFCLFLKGQQADNELTEARIYWKFDCETFPSLSDHSGRVLKISNLKPAVENQRDGIKRNAR